MCAICTSLPCVEPHDAALLRVEPCAAAPLRRHSRAHEEQRAVREQPRILVGSSPTAAWSAACATEGAARARDAAHGMRSGRFGSQRRRAGQTPCTPESTTMMRIVRCVAPVEHDLLVVGRLAVDALTRTRRARRTPRCSRRTGVWCRAACRPRRGRSRPRDGPEPGHRHQSSGHRPRQTARGGPGPPVPGSVQAGRRSGSPSRRAAPTGRFRAARPALRPVTGEAAVPAGAPALRLEVALALGRPLDDRALARHVGGALAGAAPTRACASAA